MWHCNFTKGTRKPGTRKINFSGFCAKFQKIAKSMQSINKHADLWTNIYIFHLTTSPNSQITPYRKNRRIPRRSLRTGEIGGHPRSNEARRRFIKSQPVHSPNDVLTNEVLPLHDMLISEWFQIIINAKKKKNLVFHIRRLPYD